MGKEKPLDIWFSWITLSHMKAGRMELKDRGIDHMLFSYSPHPRMFSVKLLYALAVYKNLGVCILYM